MTTNYPYGLSEQELDQYNIYRDPNPIIIRKQIPGVVPEYQQRVFVRYLNPPKLPEPGPLIIKEVRAPQPPPLPPLVIRVRAPQEKIPSPLPPPPPLVLREAPPQAPYVDTNPQYVTRVVRNTESSYTSPPQPQQYQHYESFGNGTVNYDEFNGIPNGINQFGNKQQTEWITQVVSDNGATSAAPPHLLDHIYRAVNNQLPRT